MSDNPGGPAIRRIAILGHFGFGNLGDDSVVQAIIQNIRHRAPDAEIIGFSLYPEDTQLRHGIPSYPIRRIGVGRGSRESRELSRASSEQSGELSDAEARKVEPDGVRMAPGKFKAAIKKIPGLFVFVKASKRILNRLMEPVHEIGFWIKSFRRLRGTQVLIIPGSGQLTDYWGGPWRHPYTLFQWAVIARASGTRLLALNVGAGPLNTRLGRFFIKCFLRLSSYRSFREQSSKELAEKLGVHGENPVLPDLAYSLEITGALNGTKEEGLSPIVGINPLPYCRPGLWPTSDPAIYQDFCNTIVDFSVWLIQKRYRVLLFPTQINTDPKVIDDLKRLIQARGLDEIDKWLLEPHIYSVEELLRQITRAQVILATRFHGILLSFVLNKPVLGLSYHKKTDDLMAAIGQSEFCIDIDKLNFGLLADKFSAIESRSAAIKAELSSRIPINRDVLKQQYDRVLTASSQLHTSK